MPRYTFQHKVTGEQKNETMSIASMEQYLIDEPDWYVAIQPIGTRDNFVASRHTNIPIDGDFKNMLQNMKAANRDSTIDW
jgi:hypothetical protein